MPDPMEDLIHQALDDAGFRYVRDFGGTNLSGLDFRLENGVEIEVKRMHSPRIVEQMARAENVIAAQGEGAVRFLAELITLRATIAALEAREAELVEALEPFAEGAIDVSGTAVIIGPEAQEALLHASEVLANHRAQSSE